MFLLFSTSQAIACSCPPKGVLKAEVDKNDVVFIGQVSEVVNVGALRPGYQMVRFLPMKKYKGKELLVNPEKISVFTPDSPTKCGVKFSRQIDYLVFASGSPAFLKVTSCSLTDIQENHKESQRQLEEMFK